MRHTKPKMRQISPLFSLPTLNCADRQVSPTAAEQKVYGFLMEVPCRTCDGSGGMFAVPFWSSALSLSIKSGEL